MESQIKKQEEKKKELKKKKEYIKTKEFIEKTATEKFGLLYPGEYLLKGSDELINNNRIKKFRGGEQNVSPFILLIM